MKQNSFRYIVLRYTYVLRFCLLLAFYASIISYVIITIIVNNIFNVIVNIFSIIINIIIIAIIIIAINIVINIILVRNEKIKLLVDNFSLRNFPNKNYYLLLEVYYKKRNDWNKKINNIRK